MNVGPPEGGDDELVATINTTPLVDVMLVLLIIFLITIPVVIHLVPLDLPKERNQARTTKPENITISVNRDGDVFWGLDRISDNEQIVKRLKEKAVLDPQPQVQIRGDLQARAGIIKVSFIIEPPANGTGG